MRGVRGLTVLCLLPLVGCAWARRENRPVWTAFEENLVPTGDTAFAVALPVTVPLGLLAILTDTFVAHPLQVVDDAADTAADMWRGIDLEHAYYREAGLLPFRALMTPVWFVGSFLGRSAFDVGKPTDATFQQGHLKRRQEAMLDWLRQIAAGGDKPPRGSLPNETDATLRAALAAALTQGTALGRLRVYETGARSAAVAADIDWLAGLRDASAVVRHRVLSVIPATVPVPDDMLAKLRADPDDAVRLLAERFRRT